MIQEIKERHRLIALLEIAGAKNCEIARLLKLSENWVSQVRRSPLFQELLAQLREKLESDAIDGVRTRLMQEADNTLNTLIELRDSGTKEDSVRLGAATELLSRQLPKVTKQEQERTLRVLIDRPAAAAMQAAVAEDDADRPQLPGSVIGVIRARTIEEALLEEEA